MMRLNYLLTLLLFPAFSAFALEPEELSITNAEKSNPCVVLNSSGISSLQNVLEKLDENMGVGFDFGGIEKICAVDSETRLVLFKPEGLQESWVYHRTPSYATLEKPIASQINRGLTTSVPETKELIIAGYKTMFRSACVGKNCGKKAWGGCMNGVFRDHPYYVPDPEQCHTIKIYNENYCYSEFSMRQCRWFFQNYYSARNGQQTRWQHCPSGDEFSDLPNDPNAYYMGDGAEPTTLIPRNYYGIGFPPEGIESFCAPLFGATGSAFWKRNDPPYDYDLGYSFDYDSVLTPFPGSKWIHFPYTSYLKADKLDYRKSPIFDCSYFDSHGATTICNANGQDSAHPYHAEIIFNPTAEDPNDFFDSGEKDLEFIVNGKLSLRYLDIYLRGKNAKVRFSGQGVVEFIEVAIHGEAETEALVEFGPDIDVVLRRNYSRERGPYVYGLALIPKHDGIQNYILSHDSRIVDNLGPFTRKDPPNYLGYTELKLVLPQNANHSIPKPFGYVAPQNKEMASCMLTQVESENEKTCLLDKNVPRRVIAFEPHAGDVNERDVLHFVEKRIDTPDYLLTMKDGSFYYTLHGKPIYLVKGAGTNPPSIIVDPSPVSDPDSRSSDDDEEDQEGRNPDCAEGEILNFGRCIRVERTPPTGGDRGDNEPEGEIPFGSNTNAEQTIGGDLPDPWGSIQNSGGSGRGCSLHTGSNVKLDIGWSILFLSLLLVLRMRIRKRVLCKLFVTLLISGRAWAIYPEELYVFRHDTESCAAMQIEGAEDVECYFGRRHPCVASATSGDYSIEGVLNRLVENMGTFYLDDTESKMCDVDDHVRLVLLRPEGLSDARIDVTNPERERFINQYAKTIASQINNALQVSVPQREHLVIAGYKAMYHSRCLGNVCDGLELGNAAWGHFPLEQVINDNVENVPFFYSRGHPNPHHNWILDCDFFGRTASPAICAPPLTELGVTYESKGYHAEIVFDGDAGDTLVFNVEGKLSLRYLDIYLKSTNAKVVFTGQGTVELTQVSIYGDAPTDALVEFGSDLQIYLLKNPQREEGPFAYGLGLYPRHNGIQNYLQTNTSAQLVALARYTGSDPLTPELKLVIPEDFTVPNPWLLTEFFSDSESVSCLFASEEERGTCELESDQEISLVIGSEPHEGGAQDPDKHFVHQPLIPNDGEIPIQEGGFYYTDQWEPIAITRMKNSDSGLKAKDKSSDEEEDEKIVDKETPSSDPPCPPGTLRNRYGVCVRTEVVPPPSEGGETSNETEGNLPEGTDTGFQERDNGDSPTDRTILAPNPSGCSLNVHGTPRVTLFFWILLITIALNALRPKSFLHRNRQREECKG